MEILAFPSNDFGAQEPGTNLQIKAFCTQKKVTFRIFAKISVKGKEQHPLYAFLTDKKRHPKFGGDIQWNFQKYLVDHQGRVTARFDPREDPMGPKIDAAIQVALARLPSRK